MEKKEMKKMEENTTFLPFANVGSFETAQRMANLLASSDMVPKAYQGKIGNAVIALEMANRLGASPLMVMQNLYIVHGTPSWSSKFLIACFNSCGRFSPITYDDNIATETDKKKWFCRAKSVSKETGEQLVGTTVTWDMVEKEGWSKKDGSKWLTMPEQMFKYRAASFFIRSVAPEISFGFHTTDEINDGVLDDSVIDPNIKEVEAEVVETKMANDEDTKEPQPKTQSNNNLFDGVSL